MIFFDGTYRLKGSGVAPVQSVGKWTCSWRIRIIDFSLSSPKVNHLRPLAVVVTPERGSSEKSCADSLGKVICRDFDLDINEVLWIEHFTDDPEHLHVANFKPRSHLGSEIFYEAEWRGVRPNELEVIKPFIPETENIKIS